MYLVYTDMATCKHLLKWGKSKGNPCTRPPHHDGYCWQHKKTAQIATFSWVVSAQIDPGEVPEFKRLMRFIFGSENIGEYLVPSCVAIPKVDSTYDFDIDTSTASHRGTMMVDQDVSMRVGVIEEIIEGALGIKVQFNVSS